MNKKKDILNTTITANSYLPDHFRITNNGHKLCVYAVRHFTNVIKATAKQLKRLNKQKVLIKYFALSSFEQMPALKKYSVCFPNAFNIAKVDKFNHTLEGICMHMNAYTPLGLMDFTIRVQIEYVSLIPVYLICEVKECRQRKTNNNSNNNNNFMRSFNLKARLWLDDNRLKEALGDFNDINNDYDEEQDNEEPSLAIVVGGAVWR
uniref:Uncharacterized protein n=1 Tax=Glossina austeni TaxID=7395 RepID=A0A1A9UK39_GLOAU